MRTMAKTMAENRRREREQQRKNEVQEGDGSALEEEAGEHKESQKMWTAGREGEYRLGQVEQQGKEDQRMSRGGGRGRRG